MQVMSDEKKELLSLVVPCYNEEEVIEEFLDAVTAQLQTMDVDYEIICVDDGSRDHTADILRRRSAADSHIHYISFSRNFGKEPAMMAGLEHVRGDMTVIMDADLQHPPSLLPQMVEKYHEGYDQVIARRNRDGDKRGNTLMARMYYRLVNRMVDVDMVDGAGDFRLLSRRTVDAVISLRETNRFSKGIFSWVGFNQVYIDYQNQPRAEGESKWNFGRLFRYGMDGVLSFNSHPITACMYVGLVLLACSVIYLIFLLVNIIISGIDVPGYFTIIAIISLFGGIQIFSIGIIGEYVGRIYSEAKHRPIYLIKDTDLSSDSGRQTDVK